ncbi:hypothetical protein AC579_6541 [Pseudocercospora musae]|uniref:Uncharacterized protein n=1 Tax=Pseudocercospora musae TaxID=113226 RepID=A0A139ILM0_9PEZI|nr:hypothetical protein AC579_6541 [Pseudocercospora musae]
METSTKSKDPISPPLRTSLQSEHSQRPGRSKDIYEASNRHPETGHPLQKRTGAAQRILESAAFKKVDEHVPVIRKALRRVNVTCLSADQQPETTLSDHQPSDTHQPQRKRIHLPRITPPSGPIPNSKLLTPRPSTSITRNDRNLDLYFLTPLEREIHDILHRMGRVAIYKGLARATPHSPLLTTLLAHPTDIPPLQRIHSLTQKMEPEDRHKLATTLETLIDRKMRYVLNILLWKEDALRITDKSVGTGVESPEYVKSSGKRRPTSFEIIRAGVTGVRESWLRGHDEVGTQPRLRGGGGDDFKIPGSRSAKAYARLAFASKGQEKLEDEERVPRVMWWLAGGRVSFKKRAPTAGELRRRRKVEVENRKEVGFLGTVFGVRERNGRGGVEDDGGGGKVGEGIAEEGKAKDGAGDEAGGQAEEIGLGESQAKASESAPAEEVAEAVEA